MPGAAAVMDLSPLRKFEVLGPDAEALLQAAVTRNVRKLAVGQVVYTAAATRPAGCWTTHDLPARSGPVPLRGRRGI